MRKSTYLVRDVDDETWRRFKARALLEDVSLRSLFEQFITAYAAGLPETLPASVATVERDEVRQ